MTLTLTQLQALSASSTQTIKTDKGDLVLTGYNATTGVVSYTYTANVLAHTGGANLLDDFALTVKDVTNQTGSDTLRVAITDTTPTAAPDTNSITEDAVPNTVTGSVLTGAGADTASQDGALSVARSMARPSRARATTTINGLYGKLVIQADGSYTYTLNNANAGGQRAEHGRPAHGHLQLRGQGRRRFDGAQQAGHRHQRQHRWRAQGDDPQPGLGDDLSLQEGTSPAARRTLRCRRRRASTR